MRIAVPASLDGGAFRGWSPGAPLAELGGATMGTGWRVLFARAGTIDNPALSAAIQALLDRLVAEMSHWEPGSTLGRFNRSPADSWTSLPPDFATVMASALDVARRSDGAFDPAIGALVNLWGFGPVAITEAPDPAAPDPAAIDQAHRLGGWQRLQFDPAARRLRQPGGLQLDLSGIAKGFAVDRVAGLLAERGIEHALIEVGGELAGRGIKPDADPWWVDLETPGDVAPPLRIALHQLAVATSGDYVRGRHTIDPRTGRPVEHMLAVSVLHPSAMLADAWATALGVLPREAMMALAEREALACRALIRGAGDGIAEWISPALAAMLD